MAPHPVLEKVQAGPFSMKIDTEVQVEVKLILEWLQKSQIVMPWNFKFQISNLTCPTKVGSLDSGSFGR